MTDISRDNEPAERRDPYGAATEAGADESAAATSGGSDQSAEFMTVPIGRRIHVIGNSCSGKSTLAARLAGALRVPLVELDALNWQPGWVGLNDSDPEEFERRIAHATRGDAWVVAGSYSAFSKRVFWDRLENVIWLDLPRALLIRRVLARSWRRWRTQELLWGANREDFWAQLMVWRKQDSLVWWILTQHARKRREMIAARSHPAWSHIRFVRLASSAQIRRFAEWVDAGSAAPRATPRSAHEPDR